ncbi:alpha/beta hydrolase [Algoriphagus terrigena]|uniref:alpha/beta hydrolase n=1 Tax=Algoriphagus terrigena TaxID=344884 RepID=UPI00047E2E58|nr:alpha/beta hydrolase [Algoriphagus terrigena]
MSFQRLILGFLLISISYSCAFRRINRTKEITYLQAADSLPERQLNVFSPKKKGIYPVLLFVHGGSWNSGNKEIYDFFGSRMARRKVVTVVIDYPLAPEFKVNAMEKAVVQAVKWTSGNIAEYGGDPKQIYISGHSAGGHLAGLVAMKASLFPDGTPLKGAILNDPGGLDMDRYLADSGQTTGKKFIKSFTDDPAVWKEHSPINFLGETDVPLLIMEGGKTYPSITQTVGIFREAAEKKGVPLEYSFYRRKHHIPMMTQFFFTWTRGYQDVLGFIEEQSQ